MTVSHIEKTEAAVSQQGDLPLFVRSPFAAFSLFLFLTACLLGRAAAQVPTAPDWPATRSQLVRQLDGSDEEKRTALFEIRDLQTESASRLALPALNDPNEMVRATAASSVIFLPKAKAVTALAPLLNDKADFVRTEAAYALGKVETPEATPPLVRLLKTEKVPEVRSAAVIALGQSGDLSSIDPLLDILKAKPKEENEFLRRSAARSVGQIAQIVRTGRTRVLTPQNFLPPKYKQTGTSSSPALTGDLDPAAAILARMLDNKNESGDTRREAAFALGAIGLASSVPKLRAFLNSPDPYLAEICKEALLKIDKQ